MDQTVYNHIRRLGEELKRHKTPQQYFTAGYEFSTRTYNVVVHRFGCFVDVFESESPDEAKDKALKWAKGKSCLRALRAL